MSSRLFGWTSLNVPSDVRSYCGYRIHWPRSYSLNLNLWILLFWGYMSATVELVLKGSLPLYNFFNLFFVKNTGFGFQWQIAICLSGSLRMWSARSCHYCHSLLHSLGSPIAFRLTSLIILAVCLGYLACLLILLVAFLW